MTGKGCDDTMRSPLKRRIPRELKQDMGKYLSLFLFLVLTITFVSGFLVADNSMKQAYDESFEKYSIEDGHFTLAVKLDDTLKEKLKEKDVTVHEIFYKDMAVKNDRTLRIFKNRRSVDRICLMQGEMPENDDEIVIDRLFAENNEINIGDRITVKDKNFKVVGFVAFSDYSALFRNNTDMMFDANRFSTCVVTDEAYDKLPDNTEKYCYAWLNNDKNLTEKLQIDKADEIMSVLKESGLLTDFVKRANNQAINFTGDDMGSDKSMMVTLLYVVVAVLAFVFGITIKSTIEQEASVIGTLRASGYTRWELMRHYLAIPLIVTFAAAIVGNIMGYTFMKEVVANIYYSSYSLTTYETIWNGEAFISTTIVPCIIILIVNMAILRITLWLPPLQFLRRELHTKKRKKVLRLKRGTFFTRFRTRIILQNIPAYITLFFGILLASILLIFGLIMSPLLDNFKVEVKDSMIANYQYILKAPVESSNDKAEKYSVTSLNIPDSEEVTVYGIADHSEYLTNLTLSDNKNEVIVTDGYMEKYGLNVGDTITLEKKYDNKTYSFKIAGHYHYAASLAVFMPQQDFNEVFDYEKDDFSGYFSDDELTDIDDLYIASIITADDLTVITDQLEDSMGNMFPMLTAFSTILYVLLMYLLAKVIVEKNAQSISMIKILGYNNREAGRLYNSSTAIVVLLSLLICLPLSCLMMKELYYVFIKEINGWLTFYIAPWIYPAMFIIGVVCYFIVHLILLKKVRRIPMTDALKSEE